MRVFTVVMFVIGALAASSAAIAQTYSPDYPVCLHVDGPATYIDCGYTSLPQCNATASGRAAQCEINPFFAEAEPQDYVYHRHHHHRRVHRMS